MCLKREATTLQRAAKRYQDSSPTANVETATASYWGLVMIPALMHKFVIYQAQRSEDLAAEDPGLLPWCLCN